MLVDRNILPLSWRLWQALRHPVYRHPTFRRVRRQVYVEPDWFNQLWLRYLWRAMVFIFWVYILFHDPRLLILILMAPALIVLFFIAVPFTLPFVIIIYSTYLALMISMSIRKEQDSYTYDLLCVSPAGSLPINWHIGSGVFYRGELSQQLDGIVRLVLMVSGGVLLTLAVLALLFSGWFSESFIVDALRVFRIMFEAAVVAAIFYTGYVQSMVLSLIIGILLPHSGLYHAELQLATVVSTLALQISTYMAALLLIIPLNISFYGQTLWLDLFLRLLAFIIVYAIRDLVIVGLWRILVPRLNATPDEFRAAYLSA